MVTLLKAPVKRTYGSRTTSTGQKRNLSVLDTQDASSKEARITSSSPRKRKSSSHVPLSDQSNDLDSSSSQLFDLSSPKSYSPSSTASIFSHRGAKRKASWDPVGESYGSTSTPPSSPETGVEGSFLTAPGKSPSKPKRDDLTVDGRVEAEDGGSLDSSPPRMSLRTRAAKAFAPQTDGPIGRSDSEVDLRSFFAKADIPTQSFDATMQSSPLSKTMAQRKVQKRRTSSLPKRSTSDPKSGKREKTAVKKEYDQLYLDLSLTNSSSTATCPECKMSYARGTPEDTALHAKHHKRVMAGIEYPGWTKDEVVVSEGVRWGNGRDDDSAGGGGVDGRILMVNGNVKGAHAKKLNEILSTIDTELSSSNLSPSTVHDAKVFLFVTRKKRVIGAAVVSRIEWAYRVVRNGASASRDGAKAAGGEQQNQPEDDLLRIGEDSSAIFCSPKPQPTLLGVHRIWVSPRHRNQNIGTLLLDAVAQRAIYGCPIQGHGNKKESVAFSQPTGAGQALARRWTGLKAKADDIMTEEEELGYKVFIE